VFLRTRSPGFGAGDALGRVRHQAASHSEYRHTDEYMRVNERGSDSVSIGGFASLDTNQVKG
jgi:hypothetical protein